MKAWRNQRRWRTLAFRKAKVWERTHVKKDRRWTLGPWLDQFSREEADRLEKKIKREESRGPVR